MSTHPTTEHSLIGATVRSTDNSNIGTVQAVHLDEDHNPAWAAVRTGLIATTTTLVPLGDTAVRGNDLFVPFDKRLIAEAPPADLGSPLSAADARRLLDYYEVRTADSDVDVDGTPYSSDTV